VAFAGDDVMNHAIWPPNGNLSQYVLDQFPPGYQGWGVDVGASDGISINSTYTLEKIHRWTILSVEANPEFTDMLRKHRAFVEMCACAGQPGESEFSINTENPEAFSALRVANRPDIWKGQEPKFKKVRVRVERVDDLLKKWDFPQLDILCIDTEGTELEVLRGSNLSHWKPKVIVSECWDKVGPVDLYLEGLGYKKTARNVDNDIFIRSSDG
jgi:FkbM family methyltransferase